MTTATASATCYKVKAGTPGLNCRDSPSTTAPVIRTYAEGDCINIVCQTTAQCLSEAGSSNYCIWDRTQDGCFVWDGYVYTGIWSYITTTCKIPVCPIKVLPPGDLLTDLLSRRPWLIYIFRTGYSISGFNVSSGITGVFPAGFRRGHNLGWVYERASW